MSFLCLVWKIPTKHIAANVNTIFSHFVGLLLILELRNFWKNTSVLIGSQLTFEQFLEYPPQYIVQEVWSLSVFYDDATGLLTLRIRFLAWNVSSGAFYIVDIIIKNDKVMCLCQCACA